MKTGRQLQCPYCRAPMITRPGWAWSQLVPPALGTTTIFTPGCTVGGGAGGGLGEVPSTFVRIGAREGAEGATRP